jgi:hypothetical protein
MSFTKPSTALNLPRFGGKERYTDTNEFLSPGVLIAYKARPEGEVFPPLDQKTRMNAAAIQARNIVRIANDEMAKVVILRRDETPLFTSIMKRHFNLQDDNSLAGGYLTDNTVNKAFSFGAIFDRDRRWALEQIRQKMLSLSFHLNTGIYLIDLDNANRTSLGGNTVAAGTARPQNSRGYTVLRGTGVESICGFRNGEVHVDFAQFPAMSLNSGARLIIHECCHKFLSVADTYYAWNVNYPPTLQQCLDANADSFAWTALSLATGALRKDSAGSTDGETCPGGSL